MRQNPVFIALKVFVAILAIALFVTPKATGQEKILHSLNRKRGAFPRAGLVFDAKGNLYGTTYYGGTSNTCVAGDACGTVFELTPQAGGGWTETTLHSFNFNGTDGYYPAASVVVDASGNVYGTTFNGGTGGCTIGGSPIGCGVVFELTPQAGASGWTESVLHNFTGNFIDGSSPLANLIFDGSGNLYGTTAGGGTFGKGTVFELSPNGGVWMETVLYSFENNASDGTAPAASLVFDTAGNLYGTTSAGGNLSACQTSGCGTVFELTPATGVSWTEKIIYIFGATDGYLPQAGLSIDKAGNLYGTTFFGGTYGYGTAFELSPEVGGKWNLTTLQNFNISGDDGAYLYGGVILDSKGNLYGTTFRGGVSDEGTVFELSPAGFGTWQEKVLYSFSSNSGVQPYAGVISDASGNLYGTTYGGGAGDGGTVFEVKH
jgi:uncharacterized repeat protein (TIGR03803 family)